MVPRLGKQPVHMQFYTVFSALTLVILMTFPTAATSNTFELCLDHMPPRQIVIDGEEPSGRNVDIAKAFSREVNFNLTFTPSIPFNRCIRYMSEGKTDLMMGLVQNAERDKFMVFVPITNVTKRRLFMLEENHYNVSTLKDAEGLQIGIVKHYAYFEAISKQLDKSLVFELSNLEEGFDLLLKYKLDAVVVTDHTGLYLSELYSSHKKIVPSRLEFVSNKKANLAISKHSPAVKYLKEFKQAALKLERDGVLSFLPPKENE